MPFYEYDCEKCGGFEAFVSRPTEEAQVCPKCGNKDTQKLISAASSRMARVSPFGGGNCALSGGGSTSGDGCPFQ